MKYALLSLVIAFAFTGCLMDSKPKTVQKDVSLDPACLSEDSTTWTDTTEVLNMSCTIHK